MAQSPSGEPPASTNGQQPSGPHWSQPPPPYGKPPLQLQQPRSYPMEVFYNQFQPYQRPPSKPWCFIFSCIAVLFVVGLVIGCIVLDYKLQPHSPEIEITSVSISSFEVGHVHIIASWHVRFNVKNPDKKRLAYSNVEISVYYRDELLASAIPLQKPSGQPKSLTQYEADISASSVFFIKHRDIFADWLRGDVPFDFQIVANLKYSPLLFEPHKITVNCDNVPIINSNNSWNFSGSKGCNVGISLFG